LSAGKPDQSPRGIIYEYNNMFSMDDLITFPVGKINHYFTFDEEYIAYCKRCIDIQLFRWS
jgi:hypothetical protein